MVTIQSLHQYWNECQNTLLRNGTKWQKDTWAGYNPPLAINTHVGLSRRLQSVWLEAVQGLMQKAFDHILQSTHADNDVPNKGFDRFEHAKDVLDGLGVKRMAEPSNLDKSRAKHDRYKEYRDAVYQLWLTTYNSEYELSKQPWPSEKLMGLPTEGFSAKDLRNALSNSPQKPVRDGTIFDFCHQMAKKLGFSSITCASVVSNQDVIDVLNDIMQSSDLLFAQYGVPHSAAGADGLGLIINPSAKHMGQYISQSNCIVVTLAKDKKYASSFWHEWTHMLENQSFKACNLEKPDTMWGKYKNLAPVLRDLNKAIRTLPAGKLKSQELFNVDPFSNLRSIVWNFALNDVFEPEVCKSLLHDFKTGKPLDERFSFNQILEHRISGDKKLLSKLFASWLPKDSLSLTGFSDEYTYDDQYDEKSKVLLDYYHALRAKKSQYVACAIALDDGEDKSYWSKPHELLARAMQSHLDAVKVAPNSFVVKAATVQEEDLPHVAPHFESLFQQIAQDFSGFEQKVKIHRLHKDTAGKSIVHKKSVDAP